MSIPSNALTHKCLLGYLLHAWESCRASGCQDLDECRTIRPIGVGSNIKRSCSLFTCENISPLLRGPAEQAANLVLEELCSTSFRPQPKRPFNETKILQPCLAGNDHRKRSSIFVAHCASKKNPRTSTLLHSQSGFDAQYQWVPIRRLFCSTFLG